MTFQPGGPGGSRWWRLRGAVVIVLPAVVLLANAAAAAGPDFTAIDAHVAGIERPVAGNFVEFVRTLTKPARNPLEQVRAIAWWMASHIAYDHDMFRNQFPKQQAGQAPLEAIAANEPAAVMRRGKAVCSGYAALFVTLCGTIGIEAEEVSGNVRYNDVGHKWNAVRIGGRWQLLDITYMAAGAGNARQGVGQPVAFYFLTPPELFIFSHYPKQPKWQLLPQPISRREFAAVPPVLPPLLAMVDQPAMLRRAARQGVREFVPAVVPDAVNVKLLDAPLARDLDAGRAYEFLIRADNCNAVYVDNGGEKSPLKQRAGLFRGEVTPAGEFVRIGVQPRNAVGGVKAILDYRVGGRRQSPPAATLVDEIVLQLNDARRREGVNALRRDELLDRVAAAHAREMSRQLRTIDKSACLVAAVDTPGGLSVADFAGQFIGSLMHDGGRRSWACAASHRRLGVGTAEAEGRTYFCLEFQ